MENLHTGKNGKELLVQSIQERLNWYTFVASEEEFDVEEVEKLVDLLKVLEPMEIPDGQEVGRTFEQFEQYLEEKQADAERLALLYGGKADGASEDYTKEAAFNGTAIREFAANEIAFKEAVGNGATISEITDKEVAGSGAAISGASNNEISANGATVHESAINKAASDKNNAVGFIGRVAHNKYMEKMVLLSKKNIVIGKSGKYSFPVTAAAIIVALFITGGTANAIHAGEDGGFFNWIYKGVTGQKVVMVPQEQEVATEESFFPYYDESEVPEEYRKYVAGIRDMKTLSGYKLEFIEFTKSDKCVRITYYASYGEDKMIVALGCNIYENQLQIKQEIFYDYEYLYEEELEGIEFNIYLRKDTLEQEDYAIFFYSDSIQYYVQGKCNIEVIKQIAVEYAQMRLE